MFQSSEKLGVLMKSDLNSLFLKFSNLLLLICCHKKTVWLVILRRVLLVFEGEVLWLFIDIIGGFSR